MVKLSTYLTKSLEGYFTSFDHNDTTYQQYTDDLDPSAIDNIVAQSLNRILILVNSIGGTDRLTQSTIGIPHY